MTSLKQHFLARNCIATGMSLGVIVTEAAAASGSLITTHFAYHQNGTVMDVPGNINSLYSTGPNNLIRSWAVAITSSVMCWQSLI